MSGKTVPTVSASQGTVVPAQDFDIEVVPMRNGRTLILTLGGAEHVLRLDTDGCRDLARLLIENDAPSG